MSRPRRRAGAGRRDVPTLRGPRWLLRPAVLSLLMILALLLAAWWAVDAAGARFFLALALGLGVAAGLRAWRRRRGAVDDPAGPHTGGT